MARGLQSQLPYFRAEKIVRLRPAVIVPAEQAGERPAAGIDHGVLRRGVRLQRDAADEIDLFLRKRALAPVSYILNGFAYGI